MLKPKLRVKLPPNKVVKDKTKYDRKVIKREDCEMSCMCCGEDVEVNDRWEPIPCACQRSGAV